MMLHGTIRNDDFLRDKALQCWNNVVIIRNYVTTILKRCVALKIAVASCLVRNITFIPRFKLMLHRTIRNDYF